MFNNDYIMRMIEQLVAGIALIMKLKQENKLEESAAALTGTLRKFFGLNDQSVEKLPYEDLIAISSLGGVQDAEKCCLLAQLIKEKADLESMQSHSDDAAGLYVKALNIYISALLTDSDQNTATNRAGIDEIAGVVSRYVLPHATRKLLFGYYELAGRYAKAEDILFEMLKSGEEPERTAEAGKAFYARLMEKTDANLLNGNLPRNEVLDSLRFIDRYRE